MADLPLCFFNYPKDMWGKRLTGVVGTPRPMGSVYIPTPGSLDDDLDILDSIGFQGMFNIADARNHWTVPATGGCAGGNRRQFQRPLYQSQVERFSRANLGDTLYNRFVEFLHDRKVLIYCGDELRHPQFCPTIVSDDQDWMGWITKQTLGADILCFLRMGPWDLEILPTYGEWRWIEYGWLQSEGPNHLHSNGQTVVNYLLNGYNRLKAIGLKAVVGHNITDGGDQSCWNHLNSSPTPSSGRIAGTFTVSGSGVSPAQKLACGIGNANTRWFTRPAQLQAFRQALADPSLAELIAYTPGVYLWSYSPGATTNEAADAVFEAVLKQSNVLTEIEAMMTMTRPAQLWPVPKGLEEPPTIGGDTVSLMEDVVEFNIGTGVVGSTVTIPHDLGIVPKVLIASMVGRVDGSDAVGLRTARRSFGASIGSTKSCAVGTLDVHNASGAAYLTKRVASQNACIIELTAAGNVGGKAIVQSWDDEEIVLEITGQFSADFHIIMNLYGGPAIKNVALGVASSPTGGTPPYTTDYTPLGFTPMGDGRTLGLFFMAGDTAAFNETVSDDSGISIGCFTSTSKRGVIYKGSENQANPTTVRRYSYNAECLVSTRTGVGGISWRAAPSAWLSNGWRFNNLEVTTLALQFAYLIIDGPQVSIHQAVTSTSGAATIAITGAGFKPEGGIVLSTRQVQATQDTAAAGGGLSVGFFTATKQMCHTEDHSNNVATSVVRTAISLDQVYAGAAAAGTLETEMGRQSIDTDGVTFVMNDADTGALQFHTILMAGLVGIQSDQRLPFEAASSVALTVAAGSSKPLPLGGSAVLEIGDEEPEEPGVTDVEGPVGIDPLVLSNLKRRRGDRR